MVTKIEKSAFKSLYLVDINLSHNQISTIERGAFDNCANITKLDLSYNSIAGFERNAFDEITYATEFRLEYNNLTDLSQVNFLFQWIRLCLKLFSLYCLFPFLGTFSKHDRIKNTQRDI